MSGDTLKKVAGTATGGVMGYMQADAAIDQKKAIKEAKATQAKALAEKKKTAQAERVSLIDESRAQMGMGGTDYSLSRTGDKSKLKTLTGTLG